jgi:NADH-quinone oxidoreductase subunit C
MSIDQKRQELLDDIQSTFGDRILSAGMSYDMPVIEIKGDLHHEIMEWCKGHEKWAFNHFTDITSIDWVKKFDDHRFEVVVHLRSHTNNLRLRIKTHVPKNKEELPTIMDVYIGAGWPEREIFDLMGIRFKGHKRMTRILNPDDFKGHPLRKDFPLKGMDRGSFPKGSVISNKLSEAATVPMTRPAPQDQSLPRTLEEQRRAPLREESGDE